MPQFYFNVYNDDITLDDEGAAFVDAAAARVYAIEQARVLAADTVSRGYLVLSDRIEITDEAQQKVDAVLFSEAVEIRK